MQVFSLTNYDDFSCIGSQCPWTCCRGWKILIDKESLERYNTVSGKIGDEMRNSIQYDKSGNAYMKLNEDGFCTLLNEQKLCRVYIEAGEERMGNLCKSYPRGINIYGDLYIKYICISCPEMARILFTQKGPLQFNMYEDKKIPLPDSPGFNWRKFHALKDGMFTTIGILQNRTLPISVRMQLALYFNDFMQDCLINDGDANEVIAIFTSQDTFGRILENLQRFQKRPDYINRMILKLNQCLVKSDRLWAVSRFIKTAFQEWKESQNRDSVSLAEFINSDRQSVIFENYCVYYVMQHYLESYNKTNPQNCIRKMIQFCTIFAWLFGLYNPENEKPMKDHTVIVSLISRETEHSPDQSSIYDVICDSFSEQGMGTTDYLLSLLA